MSVTPISTIFMSLIPTSPIPLSQLAPIAAAPPSFSVMSLFWGADPIVKMVMIALVMASVWSWAIIFSKILLLRRIQSMSFAFEESFWAGSSLEALYERLGNRPREPFSAVFCAAMAEWRRCFAKGKISADIRGNLHHRLERVMQVAVTRETGRLERHMGFLASVGSTAPFIGLFGTVWGIMNSFESIALAQNTSLTVVAPAIAEALFATALGLIAAIPAMVAYNKISGDLNAYGTRLDAFVQEFSGAIARQMDEGGVR